MENRKREVLAPGGYQKALRRRLNELRARYSQSDIARATKTPVTNVHRYMRVGKIPAEFCSALVESLEVNPAWLLAGEGGALLTDVDDATAKAGSQVLGMVEAMNAVSRVRLGALAGKQQQQTLRELADSVGAYDRMRERMNDIIRPVLEKLLQQYRELSRAMQLERASSLRRSCVQVARFCDDEELLWQLDEQQAAHEHLMGRVEESLRFHHKLFARKLRLGALADSDACSQAGSFVLALRDSGRFAEGQRICKAAIALTIEEGHEWFTFKELRVIDGSFDVELGRLHQGLGEIQEMFGQLEGSQRMFSAILLARALLFAGLSNTLDVLRSADGSRGRSRLLLRHACALENPAELRAVMETGIGPGELQVMPEEYESRRAALLLRALQRPRTDVFDQFEQLVSQTPPPVNSPQLKAVVIAIARAQLARLCRHRGFAQATLAAQAAIEAVPADRTVTLDLRAQHARNVLALAENAQTGPLRQAWQRFIHDHQARGYTFMHAFKETGAAGAR
ncbi:hypothetical protein PLCT2_01226 [Planctomycetaceae bacterium]|nr:hypothetical protein PLCT2_01226 [Planctomycetaceae bacterium]